MFINIILIICAILIGVGLILTFISLPGSWFVLAAYIISALVTGFSKIPLWLVVAVGIVVLITELLDNLTSLLVASKSGASKWGLLGAFIGGLIGLFIGGPFGVLIGSFIGAILAELIIDKKQLEKALSAGLATFMGFILGIVVKLAINISLAVFWFWLILR